MDDGINRPAGWYYDDDTPHTQRYWDGARWTGDIAPYTPRRAVPVPPPAPSGPGVLTIARGVALGLIAVLALGWFVNELVTSDDDLDCAIEQVDRAVAGLPEEEC